MRKQNDKAIEDRIKRFSAPSGSSPSTSANQIDTSFLRKSKYYIANLNLIGFRSSATLSRTCVFCLKVTNKNYPFNLFHHIFNMTCPFIGRFLYKDNKLLNCRLCPKYFLSSFEVIKHYYSCHENMKLFCSTCDSHVNLVNFKSHRFDHFKTAMESITLQCFKCKNFTGSVPQFIEHLLKMPHSVGSLTAAIFKRYCKSNSEYALCSLMYKKEELKL